MLCEHQYIHLEENVLKMFERLFHRGLTAVPLHVPVTLKRPTGRNYGKENLPLKHALVVQLVMVTGKPMHCSNQPESVNMVWYPTESNDKTSTG